MTNTTMVMMRFMMVVMTLLKTTMKIHSSAEDDVAHKDNGVYLHIMNNDDEDDAAVGNDAEDCANCS